MGGRWGGMGCILLKGKRCAIYNMLILSQYR